MSHQLISRNADLARLLEDGYEVAVLGGHLLLGHVPYLDRAGRVRYGTLVSTLTLAGEQTTTPDNHIAYFQGSAPHSSSGEPLTNVTNTPYPNGRILADGLSVDFRLSSKPPGGYDNYYTKMTTYVGLLIQHALGVDPQATARTFPVVHSEDDESPFAYTDTASSRAGISGVVSKVKGMRVAIVGAGGTGSYILDLVAKCPVSEIHLYDGDKLRQHNAFRSPGAVGLEALREAGSKAEHHAQTYRQLHQGVHAHPYPINEQTHTELAQMDFVFVAVDDNDARGHIVEALRNHNVPFIDVGVGMQTRGHAGSEKLGGSVRTTLVDWDPTRDHTTRIPTRSHNEENVYGENIQIAEINALNAALAVIRWKRFVGIYDDLSHERHSVYDIDGNTITNEDSP